MGRATGAWVIETAASLAFVALEFLPLPLVLLWLWGRG